MTDRFRPHLAVLPALALALWPSPPQAHPHIFVDAGLHLLIEDGQVVAVDVTWDFDELYSMLLLADHGLDPDADGVLTDAEVDQIIGFDLDWDHGFDGGLTLRRGDIAMEIGPPVPVSLTLVGPGQIRATHRREVIDPGGDGPLDAQVYDAEFYVAFEMTGEMTASGAACAFILHRADLDAAYAALDAAMADIGGAIADDDNFPSVGAYFADRMEIECAG